MIEDFGPYRVVKRIAVGGMAEIYLARQRGLEGLERTVVLKRILPTYGHNEEFVTMFLDEARLLAALSHPNIAQVFDLGKIEESYFLVMEYVRGPNLGGLLSSAIKQGKGGLPEKEALGIGLGIAEALAYVHSRRDELGRPLNIVHRDLNPANVVVSYDGAVKLIDFGIAKAATKVYETRTGVIKGTYGYIAPEQLNGAAPVDHRADVFALGVLLYEMCVGQHPFDVSDEPNLLDRILQARYKRPRQVVATFPKELDRLIASCLSPHPEGRPQDVPAVIEAITKHLLSRGMLPTMGDVAALAQTLVPDVEGPAPLRPLPPSHLKRPFGADPSRTIRLPSDEISGVSSAGRRQEPRGPTQKLPTAPPHDDEGESSETLVASMPVARRRQLASLGIIVPPDPPSGDSDMSQLMTNELPRVDDSGAAAALSATSRPPPTVRGRPRWPRSSAARQALTLAASAVLIVGVGVAAFLTARALGARDHVAAASPPQHPAPQHRVEAPRMATIRLISEPPGARVRVDREDLDEVTPTEVDVALARERVYVIVSLDGYLTEGRDVAVGVGEARFILRPLAVDAGPPAELAQPEEPRVKKQGRRRWWRRR